MRKFETDFPCLIYFAFPKVVVHLECSWGSKVPLFVIGTGCEVLMIGRSEVPFLPVSSPNLRSACRLAAQERGFSGHLLPIWCWVWWWWRYGGAHATGGDSELKEWYLFWVRDFVVFVCRLTVRNTVAQSFFGRSAHPQGTEGATYYHPIDYICLLFGLVFCLSTSSSKTTKHTHTRGRENTCHS